MIDAKTGLQCGKWGLLRGTFAKYAANLVSVSAKICMFVKAR